MQALLRLSARCFLGFFWQATLLFLFTLTLLIMSFPDAEGSCFELKESQQSTVHHITTHHQMADGQTLMTSW